MNILEKLRALKKNDKTSSNNNIAKKESLALGTSNETVEEKIDNHLNKKIYKLSYSEVSSYLQCPHKWFLTQMLKMPGDANLELLFGSAVHNTIEAILSNKTLMSMVSNNPKHIESVYINKLKEEIENVKDLDLLEEIKKGWVFPKFFNDGKKIFKELNIFERFKDYEIVDVEFLLDNSYITETDEFIVLFKGYIDLVLKDKTTGEYLILDWKTSGKEWNIAKKEKSDNFYDQLKLYKFFYSRKKNIPIEKIKTCFFNLPRENPNLMKLYEKSISPEEVYRFKKKFDSDCEKLVSFHIFALDKAKHINKNNFCNRCKFNKEEVCNDIDQYQIPKFEL